MTRLFMTFTAVLIVVLHVPAGAHHSFAAQYDAASSVTLTGAVTRVAWGNPHVFVFVAVKAGDATEEWAFEGGAPNSLFRAGWRRDSLKVGEVVTIEGYRSRDGSTSASARSVRAAGGRLIFQGPAVPDNR